MGHITSSGTEPSCTGGTVDRAVFINYRGEDSHSYGALLYTELTRQFGEDHVFLDAESIPAGADFVEELLERVRSARVVLAVIGPRWLTATDSTGRRRIDDPADWIHRELAEAFAAGVRVIPVLTEQVEIPDAADLPADIARFNHCQYRRLRYREPTADLARIVADLTSFDPTLAAAARSRDNAPRQLPAAPGLFTGRATELAVITDAATTTLDTDATVAISAIGGAGGIGKTALALHWAYQHLQRFPDGQLYVNLRGFDPSGQPTAIGDAVSGFLIGLGVDPSTLPVELDAQTAKYRSLVAGKRMLILLDNARDIDQVAPLLPGSPSCTVLVTSRHRLTGLTLHSARLLDLDILPETDARTLLARHLGPERLVAEPQAVADLLAVCAGLPLAVRIVAARAQHHPTFPLTMLAEELRDRSDQLNGLDAGDLHTNLRAVLSWSVHTLSPQAANLFGLLGITPGPDISPPAASSLAALPDGQARTALRELEHASLIQQHVPGRYRMHDLIRLYATDTAHQDLAQDAREAALRRVLDFYTHTAHTADRLLESHRHPIQLHLPAPGVRPQPLSDASAALAWLDTEHPVLLAAQSAATSHAWYTTVWQLAWTLNTFQTRRGHRHDRLAVWQAALDATAHLSDPTAGITVRRLLGYAYADLGRHEEGIQHLYQALALAEEHHDPQQQAHTHRVLAGAWARRGEDRKALEHVTNALGLYRALNQQVQEADTLNEVGWCAARLGEYDTARTHCEAALILHQHHHNLAGQAFTLDSLGYIAHHTGHHRQAIGCYEQALTLLRAVGDTAEAATTLDNLGHPHVALREHEQARAVWREALALCQDQGRSTDATRIQHQLDNLDHHAGTGS
jgi:tetratricopeptide (TPR) repeat protein